MPIQFKIQKLIIKGFRGIDNLEMDFPDGAPTYIIGSNNACKSTVMNAIAFALKGGGFHQFSPEKYDFYHSTNGIAEKEFSIQLCFSAQNESHLPAVRGGVGDPIPVYGIQVKGTQDKKGNLSHRHVLINQQKEHILISPHAPLPQKSKEEFKEHGVNYRKSYAKLDDIRENIPEVWLLKPDNLFTSLYEWKTGPLKKLSKFLAEKFFTEQWKFSYADKEHKMPEKLNAAYSFFQAAVNEFPFWKNDLKPKLENTLSQYVGTSTRIELRPSIQAIEDWLAQQLVLSFAADTTGALTPIECMGHGWQALIRLAALDVISQYPELMKEKVILLYEEPETYLHPHLCNKLRNVLSNLSVKGWMVFSTTHAPQFLNFTENQKVLRLWRKENKIVKGEVETSIAAPEIKFQSKLDERGTHEMFFAQKVILCEGKDDVYAIKAHLKKSNIDIDSFGITLVDCGSKNNIPSYAEMLMKLGIYWASVTDEDKDQNGNIDPTTEKVRKKLEPFCLQNNLSIFWPIKLESCLKITGKDKATPEWQSQNIENISLDDIKNSFPNFEQVCETIKGWILQ